MKAFQHLWHYVANLFLEREIFQTKVVEKIKTHILWPVTFFFQKSYLLCDNVETSGGAREDSDNMAHTRCMLDT